jgi:hypothetical protein
VSDDGTYSSSIETKAKRLGFILSSLATGRVLLAYGSVVSPSLNNHIVWWIPESSFCYKIFSFKETILFRHKGP